MSDSEARERRRAKILAAKDDRMAKIVGSVSGSSTEASDSGNAIKISEKPAPKPKNITDIKKPTVIEATESKQKITEKVEKNLGNASCKSTESIPAHQNITSKVLHISILLFAACLFTLLSKKCSILGQFFQVEMLKKGMCPVVEGAPWSILISVFLVVEFGEFLAGHLQCAKGTNIVIIKDLCLYLLVILILFQL